jgi:predicted nucleotidyltransferase
MSDPRADRGLDEDGYVRREGDRIRIAPEFRSVVDALRKRVRAAYPGMVSLYLYGSVPRGTAGVGSSDLDVMVILPEEPTDSDRAAADAIEATLDQAHPEIDGVGILLYSRDRILSEAERYDLGFFVACLCTPLDGEDLADWLPRYRPTTRLARDTNGDIAAALDRIRARLAAGEDPARLCRGLARKLVRTAFTLVMPRWGGWTSDMALTHAVVASYYPEWSAPLRRAVTLARAPDGAEVDSLLEFGEQISHEYAVQVGLKPAVIPPLPGEGPAPG